MGIVNGCLGVPLKQSMPGTWTSYLFLALLVLTENVGQNFKKEGHPGSMWGVMLRDFQVRL